MVRVEWGGRVCPPGFPHPRGDGPWSSQTRAWAGSFSPPAWGWSGKQGHAFVRRNVFPTRVGMVRLGHLHAARRARFPHPRGDGPRRATTSRPTSAFSHPWGWSVDMSFVVRPDRVFPTRGGWSDELRRLLAARRFSHPWGWSAPFSSRSCRCCFPTRVGMVRIDPNGPNTMLCFPHRVGMVRTKETLSSGETVFPLRGGWSAERLRGVAHHHVFPPAWGWSAFRGVRLPDFAVFPPAWGWSGGLLTGRATARPLVIGSI